VATFLAPFQPEGDLNVRDADDPSDPSEVVGRTHARLIMAARRGGENRFNWHALRHFSVSCWIEAGFTPKTVQTFVGHASLQVTMDRYGHLFLNEDHKKTMDQIAKGLFA
jgi:integrase